MDAHALDELMDKLASGGTIEAPPQAKKDHAENNFKVLDSLFENKDGFAQNSKKDLKRYFPVGNPQYALREQTLIDKVAHVLSK